MTPTPEKSFTLLLFLTDDLYKHLLFFVIKRMRVELEPSVFCEEKKFKVKTELSYLELLRSVSH